MNVRNHCKCGKFSSLASFAVICRDVQHTDELCASLFDLAYKLDVAKAALRQAALGAGECIWCLAPRTALGEPGCIPAKGCAIATARLLIDDGDAFPVLPANYVGVAKVCVIDMTDEQRGELLQFIDRKYCIHCGSSDPRCQCSNDES